SDVGAGAVLPGRGGHDQCHPSVYTNSPAHAWRPGRFDAYAGVQPVSRRFPELPDRVRQRAGDGVVRAHPDPDDRAVSIRGTLRSLPVKVRTIAKYVLLVFAS